MLYPNNSVVSLTDIGEGYNALHCLTNLITCCETQMEQWILPNGSVPHGDGTDFYTCRGLSAVLLNRRNSSMGQSGLYTCQIPDEYGSKTLYIGVNLGNIACAS